MGKRKKRFKYISDAAKPQPPTTKILDPEVAKRLPVIFGFKNLNLSRNPFKCLAGHGKGMLYVFKSLQIFSQLDVIQIKLNYSNCHPVPSKQIKKHHLEDLERKAPAGKLHQLGRRRTPERIVGYFDSPYHNLFQVCLLDLRHNLSGKSF